MVKQQTFDEWYKDWTGSDVKCENTDVRAAWDHQQKRIQFLEKAFENLKLQLENKEIDAEIDAKKVEQLNKENTNLRDMLKLQQSSDDVVQLKKQKDLYEMEVNQVAMANQQWQLKCAGLEEKIRKTQQSLDHSLWWVEKHKGGDVEYLLGGVVTSYQLMKKALENKDA
ncbi:hypothetical protein ACT414_18745 (plasmid) [Acinetobacter baumannii]